MTSHHPSIATSADREEPRPGAVVQSRSRPRWLMPSVVGISLITVLLVSGVLSPTFLLYAGLFGGCALMHLFGHGAHGGHGGVGGPGPDPTDRA
jgi:hypothetical protein